MDTFRAIICKSPDYISRHHDFPGQLIKDKESFETIATYIAK